MPPPRFRLRSGVELFSILSGPQELPNIIIPGIDTLLTTGSVFVVTRRIIRGAASKLPTRVPPDSMWQIPIHRGGEEQLATAGRSRNKKKSAT